MSTEEETKKEEGEEKAAPKKEPTIFDLLAKYEDAPDKARIEELKAAVGAVSCSVFSEEEVFVWRSLGRKEWLGMQTQIAALDNPSQEDMENLVIETCLIWASPDAQASIEGKAGTAPSLNEQIMQGSNFMPPAAAAQLVIKL